MTPSIVPMIATHIAIQNMSFTRRVTVSIFGGKLGKMPTFDECFERVGRAGVAMKRAGVPDDVAAAVKKRHELKLQALYLVEYDRYERDYLSRRKYKPGFAGVRQRMEDEHRFNQDFWLMYRS